MANTLPDDMSALFKHGGVDPGVYQQFARPHISPVSGISPQSVVAPVSKSFGIRPVLRLEQLRQRMTAGFRRWRYIFGGETRILALLREHFQGLGGGGRVLTTRDPHCRGYHVWLRLFRPCLGGRQLSND